jgi:hypothetical protein
MGVLSKLAVKAALKTVPRLAVEKAGLVLPETHPLRVKSFNEKFSGSKVRDEHGNLLPVHHGSPVRGFREFDVSKINKNDPDGPYNGFWFTSDFDSAEGSGKFPWGRPNADDAETRTFYLDLKNPADRRTARKTAREWRELLDRYGDMPDATMQNGTRRLLQEKGYDGIVHRPYIMPDRNVFERDGAVRIPEIGADLRVNKDYGGVDYYSDDIGHVTGYTDFDDAMNYLKHGTYVAFQPNQMKLAGTGNNGLFAHPSRIDKARGGRVSPFKVKR